MKKFEFGLIANGLIDVPLIIFQEKNHEVENLSYYPDVNAKNLLINLSLVEEKIWKFFN